jgi:acyl-ACP thioesterase
MPTELVSYPGEGRLYRDQVRAGVADADPAERCRLDTIARWLQDAAYADLVAAGLAGAGVWIVRRTRIVVERFPRFFEQLELETWCSAMSKLCAERRTTLRGESGATIETLTLWVNLASDGGAPRRLDDDFRAAYGPSTEGRRAKSRLTHPPAPAPGSEDETWSFRATDLDLGSHVNNAALWQVLEQELIGSPEPKRIDAEIEYPSPASGEPARVLRDGGMRWLVSGAGETLASILVAT